MKAPDFQYHAPASLQQALQLLATQENAKALAGGQSLMPMMNFRIAQPDHLVDLNEIGELAGVQQAADGFRIGAMTRQRDLLADPTLRRSLPILAEALTHVGHIQTRNRGTIGGSLCHADPAAELPTVCLALDATLTLQRLDGRRELPMRDWPLGYLFTTLEADELLTAVRLPQWPAGHGWSFVEFARRHGDFAIVSVAALLHLDAAQRVQRVAIAVGGYTDKPVRLEGAERLLLGQPRSSELFEQAADLGAQLEDPTSDAYVTSDYRRHLARVLVRRALRAAAERCGAGVKQ
jgi:carbon-monoxide dehydrogenase medium subunit